MEIKKCPFCGSEAVIEKHYSAFDLEPNSYHVICIRCQCSSQSIVATTYMQYRKKRNFTVTPEIAIKDSSEFWNRRSV